MGSRIAAVALLAFAGCFTDSGGGSADSASGGTTSGGPTAETGEATAASATSSTSASQTSSSGVVASTTDPTDESSSTGQPPATESCWGSDSPWTSRTLDLSAVAGDVPDTPTLSPDGLSINYLAGPPTERIPHSAPRDSREAPFVGGGPLPGWIADPEDLAQLRVAAEGQRLISRVGGGLRVTWVSAKSWQELLPIDFGPDFAQLTDPAIDGLGRVVIFARQETFKNGGKPQPIWALYRAAWLAGDLAPTDPERLVIPTFGLQHAQLCPVLSPDGEHLFLGSSFPDEWDAEGATLDVFESVSEVGTWVAPTRIDSLTATERQHSCPTSVTDDGCEVTLRQFDVPFDGTTHMIARREPAGQ